MKHLTAKGGERTKVLHIFSDSVPQNVRFTASRQSGGALPNGTVEIVRRPWLFGRSVATVPLAADQTFRKGFTDVDYAIYVTPDDNVEIAFQTRHFEKKTLFMLLGGLVVFAVFAAILVPLIIGS